MHRGIRVPLLTVSSYRRPSRWRRVTSLRLRVASWPYRIPSPLGHRVSAFGVLLLLVGDGGSGSTTDGLRKDSGRTGTGLSWEEADEDVTRTG